MERIPAHTAPLLYARRFLEMGRKYWNGMHAAKQERTLAVYSILEAKSRAKAIEMVEKGIGPRSPFGPIVADGKTVQPDTPEQDLG